MKLHDSHTRAKQALISLSQYYDDNEAHQYLNKYITEQQAKDKVHEELVRDVKRYFDLSHNPKTNTNPSEMRPYIEWATELTDLELQILLKVSKHCDAEIEWPAKPVEVPGILFIAPANVTISERTYKDLKTELRLLKGDIKCCEIEEIRPLVPHIGAGKLDASKHLLEHIETIERLLGVDDENSR